MYAAMYEMEQVCSDSLKLFCDAGEFQYIICTYTVLILFCFNTPIFNLSKGVF